MTHPVRAQPDAYWVLGVIPTGADLAAIDAKTAAAVNGDDGGVWTPTDEIVVDGAGMMAAGPWVASGGSANIDGRITLNQGIEDDYLALGAGHPEASIVVGEALGEVYSSRDEDVVLAAYFEPQKEDGTYYSGTSSSVFEVLYPGVKTLARGARFLCPLRVRNRATISQLVLTFVVVKNHAQVPDTMPKLRVFAVDQDGTIFPLKAADASTQSDGFRSIPKPATGAAWFNASLAQSYTYPCDQNNVTDVSLYSYFIEIVDEQGANAWVTYGNSYMVVKITHTGITRFDGRA